MTHLTLPVGRRDHKLGSLADPVTLVEYGSYDCRHCTQTESIVNELRRRLDGKICFVYRHFPRQRNNSISRRAAEAAEAASEQDRFWEMHRLLYAHAHDLSEGTISLCAATIGLDMPRFLNSLQQEMCADHVVEDFESGVHSGVSGTPTFFFNGVRHNDFWDFDTLLAAAQRSLITVESPIGHFEFQPGSEQSFEMRSLAQSRL